jgi:hypothetical protein
MKYNAELPRFGRMEHQEISPLDTVFGMYAQFLRLDVLTNTVWLEGNEIFLFTENRPKFASHRTKMNDTSRSQQNELGKVYFSLDDAREVYKKMSNLLDQNNASQATFPIMVKKRKRYSRKK